MSGFTPKTYQSQVLESIEAYLKACHELPSPSIAFTATTEQLWVLCTAKPRPSVHLCFAIKPRSAGDFKQ